jgi:2-polyprenyl-3-methyl-5-hydroxy-6-metoxy-1,4-benzoquinol methylase
MGKQRNSSWYDQRYLQKRDKYRKAPKDLPAYYSNWEYAALYAKRNHLCKIVDFGCGPAHFASVIAEHFPGVLSYTGYDFSRTAIEMAKKAAPYPWATFCFSDIADVSIAYDSHTLFTCFELLEHIDNDLEFIERLPSSAPLIFTVPGFDSASHARSFSSTGHVRARYKGLLQFTELFCSDYSIYRAVATRR